MNSRIALLADEERLGLVETTVNVVGHDGVVIAGVGGNTKGAIEQAEAGANGGMVQNPDHTYVHSRGIIEYYR